jgi:hypothetical protein
MARDAGKVQVPTSNLDVCIADASLGNFNQCLSFRWPGHWVVAGKGQASVVIDQCVHSILSPSANSALYAKTLFPGGVACLPAAGCSWYENTGVLVERHLF